VGGGKRNVYRFGWGNLRYRGHTQGLSLDLKIILKRDLQGKICGHGMD